MKRRDKEQDFWDSLGKLKLRDQIVILLFVVAIGIGMAVILFSLLLKTNLIDFHIPESTLRETADAQAYRQATYSDLPDIVNFRGTNYTTCVGGTQNLYNDYVASFRYSEEQLMLVGVFDETVSLSEFYNYALVSAIDSAATSSVYESMVHDEGYLNTMFFVYEGGVLSVGQTNYCLVSYIYKTDTGKNLVMMVLTNKTGQSAVDKSKTLVDKMLYAMGKTENGSADETSLDDSSEKESVKGLIGSPESDTYAFSEEESDSMTYDEKEKELRQKVSESAYALEYPNSKDLEYTVTVSETLEKAVFYIDYTEVMSVPNLAYIKSPSGNKFAPTYSNNDGIGMVYWEIDYPEEGEWLIHMSNNVRYGMFFAGVLSSDDFDELFGENENPTPRDGN